MFTSTLEFKQSKVKLFTFYFLSHEIFCYLFSADFVPRSSSLPFWLAEPVLVATVEEFSAELVLVAKAADM